MSKFKQMNFERSTLREFQAMCHAKGSALLHSSASALSPEEKTIAQPARSGLHADHVSPPALTSVK